ncbi:MAG: hypothetical protein Q8P22_06315, partial [Chloroflexota bacterium]|nr:hypothetical protein [Chloroflexota bacterium]
MRMLLFALSLISAAVLLAACGKEEERAPAARETPAVTTTSGPTATSAAAPAAASLRNLSSYRYSLKMELEGLESPWAQSMGSLAGETPGAIPETLELEV